MTKYILHGGETGIPNKHNEEFYQEWVKDFKNEFIPTILLVYFSRNIDEWEKAEKQDKERFAKYTNNRSVNFDVASINLETFQEQAKKADIIYIRGGSSETLMNILNPIKDKLLDILKNKVYAGSSAGVMVLSNYTRSINTKWKEGFSLLPINTFVHYSEELQSDWEFFNKNHQDNQYEWLLIPETQFIIKNY
jgi:peptidase E